MVAAQGGSVAVSAQVPSWATCPGAAMSCSPLPVSWRQGSVGRLSQESVGGGVAVAPAFLIDSHVDLSISETGGNRRRSSGGRGSWPRGAIPCGKPAQPRPGHLHHPPARPCPPQRVSCGQQVWAFRAKSPFLTGAPTSQEAMTRPPSHSAGRLWTGGDCRSRRGLGLSREPRVWESQSRGFGEEPGEAALSASRLPADPTQGSGAEMGAPSPGSLGSWARRRCFQPKGLAHIACPRPQAGMALLLRETGIRCPA